MRILLISHHRKFKAYQRRSGSFAKILAKRGYDVTLMCISDDALFQLREYQRDGVTVVETPDLLPGKMRSGWDPWGTMRRMSYLSGKQYDLIHAFETRPATIYPILSYIQRTDTPLVVDWSDWYGRGGIIKELRPKWYQAMFGSMETYFEERFRTLASTTTVIAHALGERAVSLGVDPETIYWIPNGVFPDLFLDVSPETFRTKYRIPDNGKILGFMSLDVIHDLPLAFGALKELVQEDPRVQLIMLGNRSNQIAKLAAQYGVSDNFRMFGYLPYEQVPEVLSCVDVFLLPFKNNVANLGRWPNKIGEYMAAGRPTVTNAIGEMKILFANEQIGLTAEESAEDMARQVRTLLNDADLRTHLGSNARRVAMEKYSWDCVTDELEKCYQTALAQQQQQIQSIAEEV
ncbi:MAG: glycosyltransferase family 4 protein [Nitrososphaera sp.]|nr:glycosyltransferase family 4 protein [Nitrososphaera sp.]MCI0707134.1 glycosyltransferase family 4 protein [Ignavibacteriota bacterium]